MVGFPRSSARNETINWRRARRKGAESVPFAQRAGLAQPCRRSSAKCTMTCGDGVICPRSPSRAAVTRGRRFGGYPGECIPNSVEPAAWLPRIRVAGRFVQADVPVIGCIRFRAGTSCRTMDREASTKGTAAPGFTRTETCGGVMVHGPKSGNGTRSSVYYLDSAGLDSPRPL